MEQFLYNNAGSVVIALVLFFVYGRLKAQILGDAKAASGQGEKREIGPIPLPVTMTDSFVKRGSYETHCRLNREAHDKLQAEINAIRNKMAEDKEDIIEAGNDRAERIQNRISDAVESLTGKIGEIRGRVIK